MQPGLSFSGPVNGAGCCTARSGSSCCVLICKLGARTATRTTHLSPGESLSALLDTACVYIVRHLQGCLRGKVDHYILFKRPTAHWYLQSSRRCCTSARPHLFIGSPNGTVKAATAHVNGNVIPLFSIFFYLSFDVDVPWVRAD